MALVSKSVSLGRGTTMPVQTCHLSLTTLLTRAQRYHPDNEIVTLHPDRPATRNTYTDLARDGLALARALRARGFSVGDCVATMMFNNYEHCVLFYTLALLGVCVAPMNRTERPGKLDFLVRATRPQLLFVDECFLPIVREMESLSAHHIVVCNHATSSSLAYPTFTQLLQPHVSDIAPFVWPQLHEDTALGFGFTSGSTGNPKGVIYSHKSTYVHLLMECSPDVLGISTLDCILSLAPMFHCLGWAMPHVAMMTGAKMVLLNDVRPGDAIVPAMVSERVTFFCGVPAVLSAVRAAISARPEQIAVLRSCLRLVVAGGTSPSTDLLDWFDKEVGVEVAQLWGMTETNPIGTTARHYGSRADLTKTREERFQNQTVCGYPVATVEAKVVDRTDLDRELPWDGRSAGVLLVRGPHVVSSYFNNDGTSHFHTDRQTGQVWLNTGDIATITPRGQVAITDRQKDVIKTGGEWVSSKELENHIYRLAGVAECCVVGVHDDKWEERPLAVVVMKAGAAPLTAASVRAHFLDSGFRRFEAPDVVLCWPELPHLGSGKLSKMDVRQKLVDLGYRMPVSLHEGVTAKLGVRQQLVDLGYRMPVSLHEGAKAKL